MTKFIGSVFIIAICAKYGAASSVVNIPHVTAKPGNCNCLETILAEMPSDAATCSCPNFISGLSKKLNENYQLIHKVLSNGNCDCCDFKDVEKSLQTLLGQIQNIIKVLTACDADVKLLNDAISKYGKVKNDYNSAIRSATASQSDKCGNILAQIRSIPLNSAENIMAAVLKCLNFKKC